ncbi:hypothetical protein [Bosea sp. (in: a-proteobacteria)]|nr:hypothetical protein [Bosea sp. (in: a-proteobacteria)]WRH58730.1 MAG: hypothetical protein RSE11_02735 [Bosea sp. (in: a-proteobacteria)]
MDGPVPTEAAHEPALAALLLLRSAHLVLATVVLKFDPCRDPPDIMLRE